MAELRNQYFIVSNEMVDLSKDYQWRKTFLNVWATLQTSIGFLPPEPPDQLKY